MVHNATHHAFFVTYSISDNCHQSELDELECYLKKFGIYYGIKAEDCQGEGKVHLHCIHVRDFEKFRPYDKQREVDKYGPRRSADTVSHIVSKCPVIAGRIATLGSKHALRCDPLTSSQWIEYLNKESPMHLNNLPSDSCLVAQYYSEHAERVGDPGMSADAKKYKACVEEGLVWAKDPPNAQSCRRFYRYCMNMLKDKRVAIDPKTLEKKGQALAMFMNESIYTDDEDDLSTCKQTATRKRKGRDSEAVCPRHGLVSTIDGQCPHC